MQDIRKILDVKTLRWKVEKRTLERIGHVLRESVQTQMENKCLWGRKVGFDLCEAHRKLHPSERTCSRRGEPLEKAEIISKCLGVS